MRSRYSVTFLQKDLHFNFVWRDISLHFLNIYSENYMSDMSNKLVIDRAKGGAYCFCSIRLLEDLKCVRLGYC